MLQWNRSILLADRGTYVTQKRKSELRLYFYLHFLVNFFGIRKTPKCALEYVNYNNI